MAKAFPDWYDWYEEKRRVDSEKYLTLLKEMKPLIRYVTIGNMDQIKNQGWWKKPEMYKETYFVLPSAAEGNEVIRRSIILGNSAIDIGDFLKFWYELADQHKERRFMMDYLCAVRGIEEMGGLDQEGKNILWEMISEYTWIFRLLLIKGQYDQKNFQEFVSVLIKAAFDGENDDLCAMLDYFLEPFEAAMNFKISHQITRDYLVTVIIGLVNLYTDWAAFDLEKVVSYAENQRKHHMDSAMWKIMAKIAAIPKDSDRKDFIGKVKASVPHWNKTDRAKILGIIEKSGNGPKDFMTKLMEEVGMEQFKVLALGKEYFCANCNRSSYIGEERLWGCPQCKKEGTRPRARYCDENCQKADWIKHKMEFHSVDICSTCKKKAAPNNKLRRCGLCIKENIPNPAYYCDEICQKQDWPKHKEAKHSKKEA